MLLSDVKKVILGYVMIINRMNSINCKINRGNIINLPIITPIVVLF